MSLKKMSLKKMNLKKRTTKGGYEMYDVRPCPECGSTSWHGYQRCTLCYGYYTMAKCNKCGHLRLSECPRDREELEFYETRWKVPSEE